MQNPVVTIEMEDGGVIKAELYTRDRTEHREQFSLSCEQGLLQWGLFPQDHPGFHDPGRRSHWNRHGRPGLFDQRRVFSSNRFSNELKHDRGVLSMARSGQPNSAGSQFFIMHEKSPHLDGDYAAFGKVIEGIEVVDRIVKTPRNYNDKPKTPQIMKKVTAETFGADYPEPEKI
jgi:peptidyl-prolyl cis-trans isomerase B (cyclophilin B)